MPPKTKEENKGGPAEGFDNIPAELAGFVEEQISFPPYWTAEVGKWFYAMPVDTDTRDPQFGRYVCQAMSDLMCSTGPKDDRNDVLVRKGDFFTTSMYTGLPLDKYIGTGVFVKCTGTRETKQPNDMLVFTLAVSPEDKKLLLNDRKARTERAIAEYKANRAAMAKANAGVPQFPGDQATARA